MHISIKATSEVKGHAREAMFLSGNVPVLGNVPVARRFSFRDYDVGIDFDLSEEKFSRDLAI